MCKCAAQFYDARLYVNESDLTELDPSNPEEKRCRRCPTVGNDPAVDCTTAGQTIHTLVALPGFYRSHPQTVKFFKCKDVDFPGVDPSTSTMCPGGAVTERVQARRLVDENISEATNISKDNNAENGLRSSQCAEGRVGPLCSKCGPFGEYLEVPDPNNADRTICAPCKELESKVNYAALTTALSAFLLVAFFGFFTKIHD